MKRSLISTVLTVGTALGLVASPAFADEESGLYANIGVAQLSADLDLSDIAVQGMSADLGQETANITMINGRLGYRVNKFIAIEGEAGFGLGGDSFQRVVPITIPGTGTLDINADLDIDVKNYFVGFARGIVPVSDNFDIFVRAGYGTAKAEASGTASIIGLPGFSSSASETQSTSDFAYGVGAEYHINETHGIRADFSSIGSEAQFFSAAYTIRF